MKIIDISWPISKATTGYKDRSVIEFDTIKSFSHDGVRETTIKLSSHSGTHIDAPSHFLKEGKTIDQLPMDCFVGNCLVIDMTDCAERITRDCLLPYDSMIKEGGIVLLRTINSTFPPTDPFNPNFIYLEVSGALYLAEKNVKVVGIDYLGVEHSQIGHPTHQALMNADITIIEGLRLENASPGDYFFVCLPLYTIGLEAAPARAVLIDNK